VVLDQPPSAVPTAAAFWNARDWLIAFGGTLERTRDGGRSFRVVLRTRHPILQLDTAGPTGAVARLDDGQTVRTLDGGRSWSRLRGGDGAGFSSAQDGLRASVVGQHAAVALASTDDGGRAWRRRTSPCTGGESFGALVDAVTPRLAWIVCLGQPGAGNETKRVYSTTDDARSWRAGAYSRAYPHIASRGGIGFYGYPAGISVTPSGFGLLWESRGTLFVTHDGGRDWIDQHRTVEPEVDFGLAARAFPGGRGLVLVSRLGHARVLATDDAGRSWRVVRRW
jgi:photosystem II stability/assembly factor-like uncharacterized protein